ncbi:MAG: hypothetical protein ACREX3_23515 [Gammaproteobacteria bacterium]
MNRWITFTYLLLGLVLAFALDRTLAPTLAPPRWYESFYLTLFVGAVVFAAVSIWVELRKPAIYGLLLTVPPYGLYALGITLAYLRGELKLGDYLGWMWPAVALAMSGALLNPLISRTVRWLKRRLTRMPREHDRPAR